MVIPSWFCPCLGTGEGVCKGGGVDLKAIRCVCRAATLPWESHDPHDFRFCPKRSVLLQILVLLLLW